MLCFHRRGVAERLIIDIRCDSGKMNAVTLVRLTSDLCALHHTLYLLGTLSNDEIIAETLQIYNFALRCYLFLLSLLRASPF